MLEMRRENKANQSQFIHTACSVSPQDTSGYSPQKSEQGVDFYRCLCLKKHIRQ